MAAARVELCYDGPAHAGAAVRCSGGPEVNRSIRTWLGLALTLAACGEGELETVTVIEGICTIESRLAVLVTVENPEELDIDAVTVELVSEHNCFLETSPREDAGGPESAQYSCWEQGNGNYTVRVKSGQRTWTETIDVPGGKCHVTKAQKLTIALE
jgi:hypothetical protein